MSDFRQRRKRKRDRVNNRSTTRIIKLGAFLICFEMIRLFIMIGYIETTLFAQKGLDAFIDKLVTIHMNDENNKHYYNQYAYQSKQQQQFNYVDNSNLRISHHNHLQQHRLSSINVTNDIIVDVCTMERHIGGIDLSLDVNGDDNDYDQSKTRRIRRSELLLLSEENNKKKTNLKTSSKRKQEKQRHPKVAICIRGDDRGIDNAYNMYKTLIEPLHEPDIFAVIHSNMYDPDHPINKRNNNNSSRSYEHNKDRNDDKKNDNDNDDNMYRSIPLLVRGLMKLTNQYPNDNIKKPIRFIDHHYHTYSSKYILNELNTFGMNYTLWYERSWSSYINRIVGVNALGPIFTHGSAFYQYKDLYNCNELITKNENKHNFRYDYIMIVRSDQWCFNSPLYNTDILQMISSSTSLPLPNRIYIPSGEDWWGTNDRFIIIPRQYSTYFLTQPYTNLYQNTNTDWYSLNMETVVNHTLSSIVQNSGSVASSSTCPAATIIRTDPVCFLACQYEEKPSFIPKVLPASSSSHQSKDSWKACSSPTDRVTLSSSPAWEILFGRLSKNKDVSLPDYAKGYNGYKYIHEYVDVLHNTMNNN